MAKETPKRRQCGASEAHARLCEQYPQFRLRRSEIQFQTEQLIRKGIALRKAKAGLINIPVVVHVVYKQAEENISTAQVKSQISALNRDFQMKNADKSKVPAPWKGLIANVGLKFSLATKNPQGKPTSGI